MYPTINKIDNCLQQRMMIIIMGRLWLLEQKASVAKVNPLEDYSTSA